MGEPSVHEIEHLRRVVVLVSAQVQKLRLLDDSEDNPHPCSKQDNR
jgi:hypothetical protein